MYSEWQIDELCTIIVSQTASSFTLKQIKYALKNKIFKPERFPQGWHFLTANKVGSFQSKVVEKHLTDAKLQDRFCF